MSVVKGRPGKMWVRCCMRWVPQWWRAHKGTSFRSFPPPVILWFCESHSEVMLSYRLKQTCFFLPSYFQGWWSDTCCWNGIWQCETESNCTCNWFHACSMLLQFTDEGELFFSGSQGLSFLGWKDTKPQSLSPWRGKMQTVWKKHFLSSRGNVLDPKNIKFRNLEEDWKSCLHLFSKQNLSLGSSNRSYH